MWKWLIVFAALFASLSANPAAAADNSIELTVDVPLEGLMKYNQWSRIKVTITNQGDAFTGLIGIGPRSAGNKWRSGIVRQEVTLGQGETKQVTFDLPVDELSDQAEVVTLVRGDKVAASRSLPPLPAQTDRIAAVVDDNQNAFHFLSAVRGNEREYPFDRLTVKNIAPKALPDEAWILNNIDLLALGSIPAGAITDRQLAAIKKWVTRGGVLIVSAGTNQDEWVQPFRELLDIPPGRSGMATDLDQLRKLSGENSLPVDSIPVYNRDFPLISHKQVGSGLFLFVNYDINAEPFASWQYNRQLWKNTLQKYKAADSVLEKDVHYNGVNMPLLNVSRLIPEVSIPSVQWIILIWIIYLLLVAPGLYFLLKRFDRRDWAWGIIPAFAVLLTIGIYAIGRPQVAKEDASFTVNSIRIVDDHMAEVNSAASFLTISGGNYAVKAEPDFLAVPYPVKSDLKNLLAKEEDGTRITYGNVPYLSTTQAYGIGVRQDLGHFSAELSVSDLRLHGTVTNHTSFDLQQTYVQLGMQRISLGPLKQGETKQVDEKIEQYVIPGVGDVDPSELLKMTREERVELTKQNIGAYFPGAPVHLMGFSDQALPVFHIQNKQLAEHYWNVIAQPITLMPGPDGRTVYPYGTLPVSTINLDRYSDPRNIAPKGTITYELSVGKADLQVKRVEIPLDLSPYRPFEKAIFDVKRGMWQPLERSQRVILEENLPQYLGPDGTIQIRFNNPTDQRLSMPLPFFQAEGEER
ncbi:hypothetical protein ACI7RC_02605 [Brevibacillus sp. B_LB10_24]|uniref:hypothetical protein n=1 Tax=Brevibacillus sp. B_LB10_24 TaxID=3380645 RepID=UPI0038B6EC48